MANSIRTLKEQLDPHKMPVHVAIIMDGNGRWAKKRFLPRTLGHRAGLSSFKEIVKFCGEMDIKYLTVYAFSTENWKRPDDEVNFLMDLLIEVLIKEIDELHENHVHIRVLGDYGVLPGDYVNLIDQSLARTKFNNGLQLNVAFNYGSRLEIVKAVRDIAEKVSQDEMNLEEITEERFAQFLYTQDIPDPDLVIRTGGELRLSNFLLWQLAYAELWVTDCLWPDFSPEELLKAIKDFQKRERKFGGLSDKQDG